MGNNSYQPQVCSNCQPWQSIQIQEHQFLLHNPYTNQKVLQHRFPTITTQPISDDISIYQWRLKNHGRNNLVEVFQINIPERKHTCCSFSPKASSIITENIIAISDISRLDQSQICNLVFDWTNGITSLYKQFGYFQINKGNLGWNNRMIGKSWINPNYSLNTMEGKRDYKNGFEFQRYAMKRIVELILINYNRRQTYFINQLKQLTNYNFAAAKQKIRKILINLKNPNFPPRQKSNHHLPVRHEIENTKPILNRQVRPIPTLKPPKPINYQIQYKNPCSPFHTHTNIPKENIKILRPRAPSIVNFMADKTRSRSCAGTKIEPISQIQTHIPQSNKMTSNPSTHSTLKSRVNEEYFGLQTLKKTRPMDEKEYSEIDDCKMDLSVIQSVITVKKDMELDENYYKIEESVIIRGINQD